MNSKINVIIELKSFRKVVFKLESMASNRYFDVVNKFEDTTLS